MEIKGKIKLIAQTQTFDSGFSKRQIVVTTEEQYPQDISIDFIKDKCEVLNDYNVGDSISVSINIRGNEYNGKYYVNLQGWRIEKSTSDSPVINNDTQEDDPLPF